MSDNRNVPTAVIAEDEPVQRTSFRGMLKALWPELSIAEECEDGLTALEAVTRHRPDIVFLDVQMPGLNGLMVARAVPRGTDIVFVTAYDAHAIEAFERGAVDYLLKPLDRDRLELCVTRLKNRETRGHTHRLQAALDDLAALSLGRKSTIQWISAKVGATTRILPIDEILYFQADDKLTRVVSERAELYIRKSLRELLSELDADEFWQVHRSTIVRARAIAEVKSDQGGKISLTVKGRAEPLPVSEAFYHTFRAL
jgi:DNA-binding LytR/AlgR family response regulator